MEEDLEFLEHDKKDILKSIRASTSRLATEEQEQHSELVVFPADMQIPEQQW